ncbi:ArdC-like ssDNA-binding domain-containing protein [Planomicrobium okeanokoites]|uniref:ArdC-like ssDNA-binding domain-containing protein n=1 Tax=Planomicrobium okeanokoites TaxID=244 RepID=UPI003561320B
MAKKGFVKKSAEEKKQEVDTLLGLLDEGVKSFQQDPEKFKALLKMQAMFRGYSFRNIMLIQAQLPTASYVASFKRWKELGRSVRKGEKSLRILAPRLKMEKDESTGLDKQKLIGYISCPVFDLSQTEGEPLPIDDVRLKLDGESDEAEIIFAWVKLLAEQDDCPVEVAFANGSNGYYVPSSHRIVLDPKLSVNHRAKTMVHEYVHSQLHRHDHSTAKERECVAEGVAFIVCSYFGLDTSDYSFEYVNGWSQDGGKSLMNYGTTMQKAASTIIEDIERVALSLPIPAETAEPAKQAS